ncbi:MAG TPA: hypothetical protein VHZ98_09755 [Galbitalea sp.]|nr:hypothetical protein [Galbitalea sp.]
MRELEPVHEVGLTGLLASQGRIARTVHVPGSLLAEGFRWSGSDRWTQRWWPQGIAVGTWEGAPLAIVSWFSKSHGTREHGTRITVVDLVSLQYRHVLLVAGDDLAPVSVHAGGIDWSGDRLLAAATFSGIREFRLSGILRTSRGRFLLPQTALLRPAERFRYSFLAAGSDGMVVGEYARGVGHPHARNPRNAGSGSDRRHVGDQLFARRSAER